MRSYSAFASDDEIAAIGEGLRDRTLPKVAWTHAAHFAAALWILSHHSLDEALPYMREFIRTYNESTGNRNTDTGGYHETITRASLRAAHAFRAERTDRPLFQVCNELLGSPLGEPHWILAYWSREQLFSIEARRAWIEPDIQPLPF